MSRSLTTCLVLVLSLAAPPALAAPNDSAQEAVQLASQAKSKYAAKQFREAAKLFMDAYAKMAEPTLLFNAGRSYEEAGALQEALPLFELFLSVAPASDIEGRKDADEHRASISARLKAQAKPVAEVKLPPAPPAPTLPAPMPLAPTPPAQAASATAQAATPAPANPASLATPKPPTPQVLAAARQPAAAAQPEPPAPSPSRETVWPWVVGGTGVALLVAGVVVHATAGSALAAVDDRLAKDATRSDGFTLHPSVTQRELDEAISRRDARQRVGGWMIGVGAAATAAGAWLWWREQPATAWVQPLWSPEAAGVVVAGRF
jgi:tetratricopeptide (TPR) repeat protein